MLVSTVLAGWQQHSWGPPAKGGLSLISYLQCLLGGGALELGTFAKIWSIFYSASTTSQLDVESWPPPTPLEYPGKLCCADPWCAHWSYAHMCFIYIYIHIICLFFFKVKVAVPLSSLRTLLPSCSSVVNAGAFWQRFGLQQTENLRSTQDAALGLFPLHTHPQLCCEVSLRGDVLPVAGFCI